MFLTGRHRIITEIKKPKLTEHGKLTFHSTERLLLIQFLESLETAGIYLADYGVNSLNTNLTRVRRNEVYLINEFLGINNKVLENEALEAVKYLREAK